MKRLTSLVILMSLVFLLIPGPCARAEEKSAAERGLEKIQTARNWQSIVLPQEESYLEEWKTLYPRKAWHAPNLPVRSTSVLKSDWPNTPYVFEGTEVTVVAEENDMSCMVYRTPSYKLYVGWIQSIRLLEAFPGETLVSGQPREGDFDKQAEVELSWAQACFPGTDQPYTLLAEPVKGCVGFDFEYQLIDENNARPEAIFGPRKIYVHNGEKWLEAGSFPYPALGAVRVQVWLDEPVDIKAIATVADCSGKNLFNFRQTARNFLLQPGAAG